MAWLAGLSLLTPTAHAWTFSQTLGASVARAADTIAPASPEPPHDVGRATTWPELLARLDQAAGLREARAQAQASDARGRQTDIRAWWPRLDGSWRSEEQRQRYNGIDSRTPGSAAALTLTWPVWRPADRADARAQTATADQAQWQARQRQQSLARDLSAAYLEAVEAAEHWRLTQQHLQALDTQARAHEKRLQAGLGTVLDLLETRMRQDQALARADQLASRVRSRSLSLARLSGQPVNPPMGLRPAQAPNAPAVDLPALEDATQQALSRHPEVMAAQAGVRASQEASRARSAEAWQPTLDATAGRSRTRQTQRFEGLTDRQDIRSDSIGLALNWPLFTSGLQQAKERESAALLTAAQARLDDTEARVSAELQDAYQRHAQALRHLDHQRAMLGTALATQEAVHKAWQAGLRSTTDLLDAQGQVHDARMAQASAHVAAMQAGADALALLDRLDAPHVAAWLDLIETAPMPLGAASP